MRAGASALSLLSVPLNVQVLRTLEQEPTLLTDLCRAVGSPPQTTMRARLRTLTELGALERSSQTELPTSVNYELARSGRELLHVGKIVQAWLSSSPQGPLTLGSVTAKSVIKALVEGWSTAIIRALAARPLSLADLSRLLSGLSHPSLERRLAAMRLAGQVEARFGGSRATPYAVSDWLRRSVAPLVAAARWERRHLPDATAPIARMDIDSIFLLAIPLVSLPTEITGSCRLAVDVGSRAGEVALASVLVRVEEGRVTSCLARSEGRADAWISGSVSDWTQAVVEQNVDGLELGEEQSFSRCFLCALKESLFKSKPGDLMLHS